MYRFFVCLKCKLNENQGTFFSKILSNDPCTYVFLWIFFLNDIILFIRSCIHLMFFIKTCFCVWLCKHSIHNYKNMYHTGCGKALLKMWHFFLIGGITWNVQFVCASFLYTAYCVLLLLHKWVTQFFNQKPMLHAYYMLAI